MIENTTNGGKTKNFFYYHAVVAVHHDKPFQVCAKPLPALLAYKATEAEARAAVEALQTAKDDGSLPCNVTEWDKATQFIL